MFEFFPTGIEGGDFFFGDFEFGSFRGKFLVILGLEGGIVDFGGDLFYGGLCFLDLVFDGFEVSAFFVRKWFRFVSSFGRGFCFFSAFFVSLELEPVGGFASFSFFEVVGVVAGLDDYASVFEGDDLVANTVEEVAIVGDADDGAGEGGEGFF